MASPLQPRSDLRAELLALFAEGADRPLDDARFDELALRVFRYQLEGNPVYAAYARGRVGDGSSLSTWEEIPPVPARAFKEFPLVTGDPEEAQAIFRTSGTTGGPGTRGVHRVLDLSLYDASLLPNFERHLLPDRVRLPIISLLPPRDAVPDSSLAYMVDAVTREWGDGGSGAFGDPATGVRSEALQKRLEQLTGEGTPVLLAGTAFALVHWLEQMGADGWRIQLPEGSRIMETGGFKGRSRELTRVELYDALERRTGIPSDRIVNEYGMTELLSQFYEPVLLQGSGADRRHRPPPWVRTRILDPESLDPVDPGASGLLCHLDLANLDSVCALLTEDLGISDGDGFRLLGRAPGAEPRGCSLVMEEILGAGP